MLIVVVVAEELLYFSRLGSHFLSGWSFSLAGFAPVTATVFLSYVNCTDSISAGLTGSNHFTVYWKCMSVWGRIPRIELKTPISEASVGSLESFSKREEWIEIKAPVQYICYSIINLQSDLVFNPNSFKRRNIIEEEKLLHGQGNRRRVSALKRLHWLFSITYIPHTHVFLEHASPVNNAKTDFFSMEISLKQLKNTPIKRNLCDLNLK